MKSKKIYNSGAENISHNERYLDPSTSDPYTFSNAQSMRKQRHKKIIKRRIFLGVLCFFVISLCEYFAFRHLWKSEDTDTPTISNMSHKSEESVSGTAGIIDKTKLEHLITQAETIDTTVYTEDSVNILIQELESAKSAATQGSTQDALDTAYINLTNAIQSLVLSD